MKKKIFETVFDVNAIVFETSRQKDILDVLDEMLENAKDLGWGNIFEDSSFYIQYRNNKTYEASSCGEYGEYKKKGIERIIYVNPNDTQVYGHYEVNEYGNVI